MIIDNPVPEQIPALRKLWQQAFGDSDAFLDSFFQTGFSYDRCRCVCLEGEPVAAVYLFDCQWQEKKLAYLYALAVKEDCRKQGLSRLLLGDTHAKLQQAGYAGTVLEPANPWLQGYYERLGYRCFGGRQEQTFFASGTPAEICQLGCLGYEEQRQSLLPAGGIAQAGAFTEFLQAQAVLYGGEGFVAAVSCWEPTVLEFLGNSACIPGLLKALNWDSATVRTPGKNKTSMYLDFMGETGLPGYFGLPMD